jgi:hypothetical protein
MALSVTPKVALLEAFGKLSTRIETIIPHAKVAAANVNDGEIAVIDSFMKVASRRLYIGRYLRRSELIGHIWVYYTPTTQCPHQILFRARPTDGGRISTRRDSSSFRASWEIGNVRTNQSNEGPFQNASSIKELKAICLYYFIAKDTLTLEDLGYYANEFLGELQNFVNRISEVCFKDNH